MIEQNETDRLGCQFAQCGRDFALVTGVFIDAAGHTQRQLAKHHHRVIPGRVEVGRMRQIADVLQVQLVQVDAGMALDRCMPCLRIGRDFIVGRIQPQKALRGNAVRRTAGECDPGIADQKNVHCSLVG